MDFHVNVTLVESTGSTNPCRQKTKNSEVVRVELIAILPGHGRAHPSIEFGDRL